MTEREFIILSIYYKFDTIPWNILRDKLAAKAEFMSWGKNKADVQWEISKINTKLLEFGLIEMIPREIEVNQTFKIAHEGRDAYIKAICQQRFELRFVSIANYVLTKILLVEESSGINDQIISAELKVHIDDIHAVFNILEKKFPNCLKIKSTGYGQWLIRMNENIELINECLDNDCVKESDTNILQQPINLSQQSIINNYNIQGNLGNLHAGKGDIQDNSKETNQIIINEKPKRSIIEILSWIAGIVGTILAFYEFVIKRL